MVFAPWMEEVKRGAASGGYFEDYIRSELLENPHRSTVIVKPDPLFANERGRALEAKLDAYLSGLSDEERAHVMRPDEEPAYYKEREPDRLRLHDPPSGRRIVRRVNQKPIVSLHARRWMVHATMGLRRRNPGSGARIPRIAWTAADCGAQGLMFGCPSRDRQGRPDGRGELLSALEQTDDSHVCSQRALDSNDIVQREPAIR